MAYHTFRDRYICFIADFNAMFRQRFTAVDESRYGACFSTRRDGFMRKEGIVGYAVKPGADRSLFDASGFKEGDIAIALNQQDFTDPRAMIALMRQLPSMDSIQLTVLRKGARYDISIALR